MLVDEYAIYLHLHDIILCVQQDILFKSLKHF